MPKEWDAQAFADAYSFYNLDWGVQAGIYSTMLEGLSRSAYAPNTSILIVGGGFFYLYPRLIAAGAQPNDVWAVDTSPYIQASKSDPALCDPALQGKILNIDITDADAAQQLKAAGVSGNGRVNWVVSTLVLTSLLTDQEISDFDAACGSLQQGGGGVAHIFTSVAETSDLTLGMNWQNRDYWSSRLGHRWLIDIQHGIAVWDPALGAWS